MKKLAVTAALAAALALGAPVASAHDSVVGGTVTADQVLDAFPTEITLEFSAVPKDGFNTFAVTDTNSGEVLFDAEPTINGRELTIEVPSDVHPGAGHYQVGFQITSSDGHATRGSVPFSVAGATGASGASDSAGASGESSAVSAEPTAESRPVDPNGTDAAGMSPVLKWLIALVAVLAAGSVLIMLYAKKGKNA